MICKPKTDFIEARIVEAINLGTFRDRSEFAASVFTMWRDAHLDPSTDWKHGTGKKTGVKPPRPDQDNPYASLKRYLGGRTPQNKVGWELFAQLLDCDVGSVIEVEVDGPSDSAADAGVPMFVSLDGDLALRKLANIENLDISPRDANFVSRSPGVLQTLGISGRVLFNSILNEPIIDLDGSELAVVDLELRNAYVILSLSDPDAHLVNSVGLSGQERLGGLLLSYHGHHSGKIVVEVASDTIGVTLAGKVANIDNLFEVKAKFSSEDHVSVGFDRNSIVSKKVVQLHSTTDSNSELRLRRAIENQLIARGVSDAVFSDTESDIILATKKRFRMDEFL